MLAETLREWEERLVTEGRRAGHEEGRRIGHEEGRRTGREEGRREERARLCKLAEQHFDAQIANALAHLLATADDASPESRPAGK